MQFPTLSALMGYDPLGRRTTFSKGATSKTFFYLGQSMLSDGTARFLQGTGIDQPLQVETSLNSSSYLQDHLGSTSQLVDTLNGSRRARYDYTSYGTLEGDESNPMPSNPFTYTGREEDGTGLLYYRARYYDPELGVFISQDPLGDAQRYVGGNPIGFVDPLGLQPNRNYLNKKFEKQAYLNNEALNDIGDSTYSISIHGGQNSVGYWSNDHIFHFMSPNELKKDIESDPAYPKSSVILLLSCNTGNRLGAKNFIPFAQHLADITKKPVLAPTGYIVLRPNGYLRVDNVFINMRHQFIKTQGDFDIFYPSSR